MHRATSDDTRMKTLVARSFSRRYAPLMPNNNFFRGLALAALIGCGLCSLNAAEKDGVQITQLDDRVRVEINGELFTEYWFRMRQHPALLTDKSGVIRTNPTKHTYFYPLIGPGGVHMNRSWPMFDDPAEKNPREHEHHRSLWFSHGAVNGVDFWAETAKAGKIQHDQFLEVKSGQDEGIIKSACKWVAPDGKVVCTDERTFRVYNR